MPPVALVLRLIAVPVLWGYLMSDFPDYAHAVSVEDQDRRVGYSVLNVKTVHHAIEPRVLLLLSTGLRSWNALELRSLPGALIYLFLIVPLLITRVVVPSSAPIN